MFFKTFQISVLKYSDFSIHWIYTFSPKTVQRYAISKTFLYWLWLVTYFELCLFETSLLYVSGNVFTAAEMEFPDLCIAKMTIFSMKWTLKLLFLNIFVNFFKCTGFIYEYFSVLYLLFYYILLFANSILFSVQMFCRGSNDDWLYHSFGRLKVLQTRSPFNNFSV